MQIVYRKLHLQEAKLYRAIRLESLLNAPDAYGATYREEAAREQLRFEMFIAEGTSDKFMIGAFENEELVGICGFIREEQERSHHRGILIQMYVKPAHRGLGIGQGLLRTVLTEGYQLTGVELITLGVVSDNTAAIKLYEQQGFGTYGSLEKFYKNGDIYLDHLFMSHYRQSPD